MKQVWYEWKKLISDKSVLLVVVLSMCIVLGYQWKNADSYSELVIEKNKPNASGEDYDKLFTEIAT